MNKDRLIEVDIIDAAYEGKGVGKIDGKVVFVDNTAPGDKVLARVFRNKKSYTEAKLISVIEKGITRREPRCGHASYCGGCTWQHVDYAEQLRFKQQHVKDHLHRIGHLDFLQPLPVIPCSNEFYYRNKMEYTFSKRRWLTQEEINSEHTIVQDSVALGLHISGYYDKILNLKECYLQNPISYEILDFTRNYAISMDLPAWDNKSKKGYLRNLMIRNSEKTNEIMVNLVTFSENHDFMSSYTNALLASFPGITTIVNNINDTLSPTAIGRFENIYHGEGFITDTIGVYEFQIGANTFFQTNTAQAEKLYEMILNLASPTKIDTMYDLYCGVGSISLFVSSLADKVIGIEINGDSIKHAKENAARNNVDNCFFEVGDTKNIFSADTFDTYGYPHILITDPPRAGMHPDVLKKIMELKIPRIVYVSCNSTTLARDLSVLNEHYSIECIQPIDMFPQTYHIETVTQLKIR